MKIEQLKGLNGIMEINLNFWLGARLMRIVSLNVLPGQSEGQHGALHAPMGINPSEPLGTLLRCK